MPEEESSQPRPKMPLIPILLILMILGFALFGEKGILRALQASRYKATLEAELQAQEETIKNLKKEIGDLRSNREHIEGIARRELGMVKEDELVYQYLKQDGSSAPASP